MYHNKYQTALTYWLLSTNRNGHAQVNGLDMAGVPSPVKMEEEQRRQCQDILDKMPEHRFLFQQMNMKQEPMMMNGNGELPPIGSMNRMPGHAPRGRPPASMQNNGVLTPDRKHVCPHCYKTFKSRQQLMQHNLVHSNLRKYRCNFCERAFKQLSHLHQHHRIHTGEKPYRCPLLGCDRAFPQLSNLQHHIRNHDKLVDSTFQCLQCDRAYPNEATLKAHNTRMHLHAKPLDLRQNHAPTQIQTTQQPQSSMAPSSMTSMISPFDNIQNHFNTQRSRKRKASRPQQLFMTSNMTHAQGGPLTPEDDDVVIVEAKQICTSLGGNEVPSEDQCSKGVKRFSSMDGKQLRAFQQSMANVIVKDDSQREAIRGFPFQRNESRETLSFELSQQNNIMNAFHTPDREGGGGFPIDMRGNRFPLHSQTKNLTHLRETTHRKYQSQFNFPFSPHGFDQSVWQPKHFNTKFVDVTCSPVHRDSNVVEQDMFAEDDDALVTDFEENQRRRRELILSYHKQYAEKKLGKKDGGDLKSENNSEDEDFFDGGHNTRYTKTNDVGHENEVPRQRNQHHTHTFSSTCHQNAMNKNDHGEKTVSMQDKECMKIEKQQKNGLEFSYRNGYDHDFNVYKEQAFDNYRKLSRFNNAENYQQSLPYQYIADDIPTCESSSGDQKLGQNDERKLKGEQLIKASHTDKGREDYREALRNAYLNKTTNQRRGDSGYWSTSTGSQRSVDEVQSQSSTEDVGQPHHSFSSRIPLDVFEDPMN